MPGGFSKKDKQRFLNRGTVCLFNGWLEDSECGIKFKVNIAKRLPFLIELTDKSPRIEQELLINWPQLPYLYRGTKLAINFAQNANYFQAARDEQKELRNKLNWYTLSELICESERAKTCSWAAGRSLQAVSGAAGTRGRQSQAITISWYIINQCAAFTPHYRANK